MRAALLGRIAIALPLAAGLLAGSAAPAPAATTPIQPGTAISTSVGGCTLNFVYDGTGGQAGKVFMGTAAHCVDKVGDDVTLPDTGEVFGDVAAIGNANADATDWSLIQVRAPFVGRVVAGMKGNLTYPKGVTNKTETAVGDQVQLSGYGVGFGFTGTTRERRIGTLSYDDDNIHEVVAPLIFGDSGGPIVHVRTGKALGIVSRLCVGACEEVGPTVQGVLAKAAAAGFTTTVRVV